MDTWVKTGIVIRVPGGWIYVSILVLMDTWVKTPAVYLVVSRAGSFNPCFNGYMGKDNLWEANLWRANLVSILVLMDTWVKTYSLLKQEKIMSRFQSLF